jgi:hypothetical protein
MGRAAKPARKAPIEVDDPAPPRDDDAVLTQQDRDFLASPPDEDAGGTACTDDKAGAPPSALFTRVSRFLDEKGLVHEAVPERGFHAVPYRITDASVRVILDALDDGDRSGVLALALLPVRVPERRRAAVGEALCRINFESCNGTFEMDFTDGELRVRTFADLGAGFSDAIVDRALGTAIVAADKYFAALMAVAFGNADPARVVELAEKAQGRGVQ